ncbi:MAG: hypothetical protein ACYC4L_05115 [Chloroflexota bacterium]
MHNDMTMLVVLKRVEMGATDADDAQALRERLWPDPAVSTYAAAMLLLARSETVRELIAPACRRRLARALTADLGAPHMEIPQ